MSVNNNIMKKNISEEVRRIRDVIHNVHNLNNPNQLLREQDLLKLARSFTKFTKGGRVLLDLLPDIWKGKKVMNKVKETFGVNSEQQWEELLNKYIRGNLDEVPQRKLMVILGETIPEMRPFLIDVTQQFIDKVALSLNKNSDDYIIEILNNPKASNQFKADWLDEFGTNPPNITIKEMVRAGGWENKLIVLWQDVRGFMDKFKRSTSDDVVEQMDNSIVEGLGQLGMDGKTYSELQELFNEKFSKIFEMKGMEMNYNSLDDLVEALATALSKNEPLNLMLNQDLYKLLRTQKIPRNKMMEYLRNNQFLKKEFQNGRLSDDQLTEFLGSSKKSDLEDLKKSWTKRKVKVPVIGPMVVGIGKALKTSAFWKWFAITQVGSMVGSSIIQVGRLVKLTDKAAAGTHQDFYAQIRGAKDIVVNEGGYTDEKAIELANRLNVIINYFGDNEDEIRDWYETNLTATTVSDESVAEFNELVKGSGNMVINNMRYILGTDDGAIVDFYDDPPEGEIGTILAASQICYFYETEVNNQKDKLWTDLKSMQAYMTGIPVIQHLLDEGEEQITNNVGMVCR